MGYWRNCSPSKALVMRKFEIRISKLLGTSAPPLRAAFGRLSRSARFETNLKSQKGWENEGARFRFFGVSNLSNLFRYSKFGFRIFPLSSANRSH